MIPRVLKPICPFTNRLLYQRSQRGACSTATSAKKLSNFARGVHSGCARPGHRAELAKLRQGSARDGIHQPRHADANQNEQCE
jgi:hypothetical protein